MPRARNIKPAFFKNEDLVELPFETRLLFIGLWTLADREGKLEDRPKRIKMELFPADSIDVDAALDALQSAGLIERYTADGQQVVRIPKFLAHQKPHRNESDSVLPDPTSGHGTKHVEPRPVALRLNPDSLNPDSLNPEKEQGAQMRTPDRFDDFWQAYPVKRDKKRARDAWKRRKLDSKADDILADIERRKLQDRQWLDGYIPHPSKYISGERWQDEIQPRLNGSRTTPKTATDAAQAAIEYRRRMQA